MIIGQELCGDGWHVGFLKLGLLQHKQVWLVGSNLQEGTGWLYVDFS